MPQTSRLITQIAIEPARVNGLRTAALHQFELLSNWHRLHNEQPAEKIRPLE